MLSSIRGISTEKPGIDTANIENNPYLAPKSDATKKKVDEYDKQEIDRAVAKVRAQPNSVEAHFMLAETYGRMDHHYEGVIDSAIQEYKIVIKMKPDHAQAYFGLANSYYRAAVFSDYKSPSRRPNAQAATTYFRDAIRLDPDRADAHAGLGKAYELLNKYDEALAALKLAISLKPNEPAYYRSTGSAYWLSERYDEAIRAYESACALRSSSDCSQDYQDIGNIYENTERYEQAVASYQRAIEFDTDVGGVVYEHQVECFNHLGRIADGIKYFERLALKQGNRKNEWYDCPASVWPRYALGISYFYSGDSKAALAQYKFLKEQGKGTPAELAEKLFGLIYEEDFSIGEVTSKPR